jgi:hypothetical protein
MTKPIGYYCSVTPGDGSFLDELQKEFGSTFEKLTLLQKAYILSSLINNYANAQISVVGTWQAKDEINEIANVVDEIKKRLVIGEHLGLADFIINQLKKAR